jgi:uncharacterized protein YbjT (DUF2867 family)
MTRNPDRVGLPPQVEVVRGDLTDADALERCLDGVDVMFLVWTAPAGAANAAVSRIARHTQRVVLLTSPHKTPHLLFQQPNPVRELHAEIERLIEVTSTVAEVTGRPARTFREWVGEHAEEFQA